MADANPFVGREPELAVLRGAFEDARDRRGSVVLVSGEPGIGKTRLVRELETVARAGDAIVLWGRSHEVGGAPPYWPWVQVLQALTRVAESQPHGAAIGGVQGLRAALGDTRSAIGSLVPALDHLDGSEHERHVPDPESARFQLFVAVDRLLVSVAEVAPIVVVLDDLQWADPSTLSLLELVASNLAREPILVIATHRDVRDGPLVAMTAALARIEGFQSIELDGIGASGLARYLTDSLGTEPSAELVRALHDRTAGNPFFMRELIRGMTASEPAASPRELPMSIRAALAQRLEPRSEACRELLRCVAVTGRSVGHDRLARLAGQPLPIVVELVDEAVAAGILEATEPPGEYRFTHDLMREALIEALPPARVAALRTQIALAIESFAETAETGDHTRNAELARHFVGLHGSIGSGLNRRCTTRNWLATMRRWCGHGRRRFSTIETHSHSSIRSITRQPAKQRCSWVWVASSTTVVPAPRRSTCSNARSIDTEN